MSFFIGEKSSSKATMVLEESQLTVFSPQQQISKNFQKYFKKSPNFFDKETHSLLGSLLIFKPARIS